MGENVIKYVVHGEVVGRPSLPNKVVAGTRQHGKNRKIRPIEGRRPRRSMDTPMLCIYYWARPWISISQTRCALVSAWPANAAVSFQLVSTEICKERKSVGIICYSYLTITLPIANRQSLKVVGISYCRTLLMSMIRATNLAAENRCQGIPCRKHASAR